MRVALLLILLPFVCGATTNPWISVTGEDAADVVFNVPAKKPPTVVVKENTFEFDFDYRPETSMDKVELNAPHTLLRSVSLYQGSHGNLKGKIIVNGSLDGIDKRVKGSLSKEGYSWSLKFPEGRSAVLSLLEEEQKTFDFAPKAAEPIFGKRAETSWGRMVAVVAILCAIFLATFFGLRYLKRKGVLIGSRKHLVEQMTYCPVGPGGKVGVSILKVGNEFVLVGVTGNSVTFLSQLPQLGQQYAEESQFERDTFKDAVDEEFHRIRRNPEISA